MYGGGNCYSFIYLVSISVQMMGLDFPRTLMKNSNPSSEDCLSLSSGKRKSLVHFAQGAI